MEKTYEEKLQFYRDYIDSHKNEGGRLVSGYVSYLRRWFSEEICDGARFSDKYRWKKLPMPFNVWAYE